MDCRFNPLCSCSKQKRNLSCWKLSKATYCPHGWSAPHSQAQGPQTRNTFNFKSHPWGSLPSSLALSLCLAGKGKFKWNETENRMAPRIRGSTGVFTHRMSGPMSIFGHGEGLVYNCSDLSLNWALKHAFAMFLRGLILFGGERLFREIFFRKVAGGSEEIGTSSEYPNVIWKKKKCKRCHKSSAVEKGYCWLNGRNHLGLF